MTNTQEKIRLLSRANRGRATIPSFLASLSEALGEPVEAGALVALPETDFLFATFRECYRRASKAYRRFFRPSEEGQVYRIACCLGERLAHEEVFLLTKLSEICGAVRLSASTLLERAEPTMRFDGDSICALSKDCDHGVLIDHNPDELEQAYEISVWGERWESLILACDPSRSGEQ